MNKQQLIKFGEERHGDTWKSALADETGWSYWTFHRIASGQQAMTAKLERALKNLPTKPEQ
jgi:hypothetical protein